jgi:hypothetical protein
MHSKQGNNYNSEKSKAKEAKNSPIEGEVVRPQALDQSYTVPKNNSMILAKGVSLFSKLRLFLSLQIVHIRKAGIKFQTPEECFPNQFHQPNNTSGKSVTCLQLITITNHDCKRTCKNLRTVSAFLFVI